MNTDGIYKWSTNRHGVPVIKPVNEEVWGKEDQHQQAYTDWARYNRNIYPELDLYHHIPNGGRRDKKTAARLKAQGVKAGVPDIFIPAAKDGYCGLYIELKVDGNYADEEQNNFLNAVTAQGYFACIAYGWKAAAHATEQYFNYDLQQTMYIMKRGGIE